MRGGPFPILKILLILSKFSLYRRQRPGEDLPSQQRLGDEAENDVHPLAKEIVLPLADFPILQDHV